MNTATVDQAVLATSNGHSGVENEQYEQGEPERCHGGAGWGRTGRWADCDMRVSAVGLEI